jgi:hypothetical protein
MNEFGEPNMGNPSVRFDEGRSGSAGLTTAVSSKPPPSTSPTLRCASEGDRNAGASPARRVRLFTTEHDLNSVAARRGWKLRKMSRRAVMKMNHIQ